MCCLALATSPANEFHVLAFWVTPLKIISHVVKIKKANKQINENKTRHTLTCKWMTKKIQIKNSLKD